MSKFKILIIIPKYNSSTEKDYQYSFPIGLAYISAALEKAEIAHDCINLNHLEGNSCDLLEDLLKKNEYDIVGIGGLSILYADMEKIFSVINNYPRKIISILGGPIITTEPELMLELLKPSFGILGEGDITIVELIHCLENNQDISLVKGIIYQDGDDTVITPYRTQISNIDTVPFPALDKCGYQEWLDKQSCNNTIFSGFTDYPRLYSILGSRGCPFSCTFCFHYNKYKERSIENIFAELEPAVMKYKINIVSFNDDCLSIKKSRIYEFCKRFRELKAKVDWDIKFRAQLMAQTVDHETLDELKRSGCSVISYGFESYSQQVLDSMHKPLKPENIDFALKETQKRDITVHANFILGDVAETIETANKTLEYWKTQGNGQIVLAFIQPYPGSVIYNHCIDKNIISDKIDFIRNNINCENPINFTNKITDSDFNKLVNKVYEYRRRYRSYAITSKQTNVGGNIYELTIKCPFCKSKMKLKNMFIENIKAYQIDFACRVCTKRITICNLKERIKLFLGSILYSARKNIHI